jgi:photosystem II stability/assembly factor-like uncharacterized protein
LYKVRKEPVKKTIIALIMLLLIAAFPVCERNDLYTISLLGQGHRIITADYAANGYIYLSDDGGDTWVQKGTPQTWVYVTAAVYGYYLAAVTSTDIYTSTDGGNSWIQRIIAGSHYWSSISSSLDGSRLFATDYYNSSTGYLYTSSDGGSTWTPETTFGIHYWGPVVSSADGSRAAVTESGISNPYIFTFSGGSWKNSGVLNGGTAEQFSSIASSWDGRRLAVCSVNSGSIYTSADGGVTWIKRSGAPTAYWWTITSSSNGEVIYAAANASFTDPGDYIWRSADGGSTWTQLANAGQRVWRSIATSSDGRLVAAGVNGGYLYVSKDRGATWEEKTGVGTIVCNSILIINR